jgi:FemAB-related protein (PEP-CTERM system-associated)
VYSQQASVRRTWPAAAPVDVASQPAYAARPSTADMLPSIISLQPADAERWDAYVQSAPGASLYHMYGWRRVIESTFGHRCTYLAAVDAEGQIVGALPLVELSSVLFGRMLISMPFFNYGGIVASSAPVERLLFDAAVEAAEERRADFVELRHDREWIKELPQKTSKVAMHLQLPANQDELWKALGSKLRNQVQRPRKEGMTERIGREELLDAFYDVFAVNMRDLGTPVYSKAFFRNILRQFPDRTWISCVYAGSVPVAAGFLAGFRDRLEIPWASALREYNRSSPNMLLYWSCLEFACKSGYRVFDFGRSTIGEGTYRFKEQWGARPHPLYWHYWLPEGREMPQVNPANPKYKAAIAAWQRLPVAVTRVVGPRIVKYLP